VTDDPNPRFERYVGDRLLRDPGTDLQLPRTSSLHEGCRPAPGRVDRAEGHRRPRISASART
jgi:hypothetical protein